jgi:hypothetical protein
MCPTAAALANNLDRPARNPYTISAINLHHPGPLMRTAPVLSLFVTFLALAYRAHSNDLPCVQRKDVVFGEVGSPQYARRLRRRRFSRKF